MIRVVVLFASVAGMLFLQVFATCGTLTETGGGLSQWGLEQYAKYEHGWPFAFGIRVDHDPPNCFSRFAVFSGETDWEWWALLADLFIALLLVPALWLLIAKSRRFSLRTMLIGIMLLTIPLAQLAWTMSACGVENATLARLESARVYFESEYVGPRWLARLTGTVDPFGLKLFGTTYVRVEEPLADISRFVESVLQLRYLKKVELWDGSVVSAGSDFRLRLYNAFSRLVK